MVLEPDSLTLREYIRVGSVSGSDLLTVTRGEDGSASGAQAHASGAVVRCVFMHQMIDDIFTDIEALETADTGHFGGTDTADHPEVTPSVRGFSSAADKTKLDATHGAPTADQHHAQLHQASHRPGGSDSLDLGVLGYVEVTADQSGITTETDLTGLSIAVTVGTSRRIKVIGNGVLTSNVANDAAAMKIKEGGTQLQDSQIHNIIAGQGDTVQVFVILTPSSGAHTYKLAAVRSAGTGSVTMVAASTFPAFILVEDIGPA